MSSSPWDITDDKFELRGEWWLPENPEQGIFGILNYEKGTGTLELQGVFDKVQENFLTPFDPEIIHYSRNQSNCGFIRF